MIFDFGVDIIVGLRNSLVNGRQRAFLRHTRYSGMKRRLNKSSNHSRVDKTSTYPYKKTARFLAVTVVALGWIITC